MLATFGPPAVIASAVEDIEGVDEVYLFGSWAARYEGRPGRYPNDIDVLVIGEPAREEVYDAVEAAERRLGQLVQMTFRTPEQWNDRSEADPFLTEVRSRPLVKITTKG